MTAPENKGKRRPPPSEKSLANLKAYQFKPGQSGNPAGRPKGHMQLAREAAEKADVFGYLVRNVTGENPRATEDVRLRSAIELLNRGYGKPVDVQLQARIGEGADNTAEIGAALESLARVLSGRAPEHPQIVEGSIVESPVQTTTELTTVDASSDDNPSD